MKRPDENTLVAKYWDSFSRKKYGTQLFFKEEDWQSVFCYIYSSVFCFLIILSTFSVSRTVLCFLDVIHYCPPYFFSTCVFNRTLNSQPIATRNHLISIKSTSSRNSDSSVATTFNDKNIYKREQRLKIASIKNNIT